MSAAKNRHNILLVDDHPLLLEGLARMVNAEPGLGVCGMAADVQEALAQVEALKPDLVITDLTLPGRNGLEFIKDLAATHPEIPVIVLSMHDEMIYAERVLRAGGRGYVMKDTPPGNLLQAIRTVLGGGVSASQKVTNHLLKALVSHKTASRPGCPMECLTDREMEVFELIGQAKSNHEIATQLGISPRTLDAHRAHIREKLGLADGSELTRHAIRWIEVGAIES
ncbi:MAG: DNA-binding response regulator [Verrucomicrobiaceae bacterium]|nr:MAG: DNA-binding response regulator [Verrucomicrobiaceae bacterium]